MRYSNFEYDKRQLSDFGCVVGTFSNANTSTNSDGNRLSLNTATFANVDKFRLINPTYDKPYSHSFQIVKSNCETDGSMVFRQRETYDILRWLNRKEYHKFLPLDVDSRYMGFYYNVTFNVGEISMGGDVVGFSLELIADAPFGYYDRAIYFGSTSDVQYLYVDDSSNEIRSSYVDMKVQVEESGTLEITNSAMPRKVIKIDNCQAGETITFHGDTKIIESDYPHTKLYNDFNYIYPRIVNSIDDYGENFRENKFTTSLPCQMEVSFDPICKLGLG